MSNFTIITAARINGKCFICGIPSGKMPDMPYSILANGYRVDITGMNMTVIPQKDGAVCLTVKGLPDDLSSLEGLEATYVKY